jgi:hypothetical protein
VFVLMVNDRHLQALAEHRFGKAEAGERYLDKFVDLRLRLEPTAEALGRAAALLITGDDDRGVQGLPDYTPYGDDPAFSKERAAELIARIVEGNGPDRISMRQIKRVVDRLELVLRCYPGTPIDLPLLVKLCFTGQFDLPVSVGELSRRRLIPELHEIYFNREGGFVTSKYGHDLSSGHDIRQFIEQNCAELLTVAQGHGPYDPVSLFMSNNIRSYIPDHQAMLDHVHRLQAGA